MSFKKGVDLRNTPHDQSLEELASFFSGAGDETSIRRSSTASCGLLKEPGLETSCFYVNRIHVYPCNHKHNALI